MEIKLTNLMLIFQVATLKMLAKKFHMGPCIQKMKMSTCQSKEKEESSTSQHNTKKDRNQLKLSKEIISMKSQSFNSVLTNQKVKFCKKGPLIKTFKFSVATSAVDHYLEIIGVLLPGHKVSISISSTPGLLLLVSWCAETVGDGVSTVGKFANILYLQHQYRVRQTRQQINNASIIRENNSSAIIVTGQWMTGILTHEHLIFDTYSFDDPIEQVPEERIFEIGKKFSDKREKMDIELLTLLLFKLNLMLVLSNIKERLCIITTPFVQLNFQILIQAQSLLIPRFKCKF